ncbi:VOC family protein [Subtercola sp. YIM 133946]|uniref:VOC family protein n=1 Tax=Subtercola sp. YIM 133946 TaxID=3118909 RepID=UPI002F9595EB
MTITHVRLFSVPVSDQDRARDFYVDTLGFDLVDDVQMSPDMRWVVVSPPGAQTAITLVTWFGTMPAGSVKGIVLETDDLDGEVERLRTLGVSIGEIERAPWGTYVTIDDPDGNGIVLQTTALFDAAELDG